MVALIDDNRFNADGIFKGKQNIKIALIQIKFDDYIRIIPDKKNHLNSIQWKKINDYCAKVRTILNNIKAIYNNNSTLYPDIIVFPEYSIPGEILAQLKEYSEDFPIIIAGSHLNQDRINVCPVIIKGQVRYIEKNTTSKVQGNINLNLEGNLDRSFFQIFWSNGATKLSIVICICVDYLQHHDKIQTIESETGIKLGVIIVPMCSESMGSFFGAQDFDVRKDRFVLLCNAISSNTTKNDENAFIGGTAIYGPPILKDTSSLHRPCQLTISEALEHLPCRGKEKSSKKASEGVLITRINVANPSQKRGKTSHSDCVPIKYIQKYYLDEKFQFSEFPSKTVAIINPNVIHEGKKILSFNFMTIIRKSGSYDFELVVPPSNEVGIFNAYSLLGETDLIITQIISDYKIARDASETKWRKYSNHGYRQCFIEEFLKFRNFPLPDGTPVEISTIDEDTREKIKVLCKSWDERVFEEIKGKVPLDYILGQYDKKDLIDDFMAFIEFQLTLDGSSGPKTDKAMHEAFKKDIVKDLFMKNEKIESVYRTREGIYIIEMIDEIRNFIKLTEDVCDKAKKINVDVRPTTYIVRKILNEDLPMNEGYYRITVNT